MHSLVLKADHISSAYGTPIGYPILPFPPNSLGFHHLNNLGDDVSRPLNDHGIPNSNIFLIDFILVMQGCPTDFNTPYPNRFQNRHRCDGSGPPHLGNDIQNLGHLLFRPKFVSQSPTRIPGDHPQSGLKIEIVHLNHNPVDFILQCFPFLRDFIVICDGFIDIPTLPRQGVNAQPPMGKGTEKLPMCLKGISYNFS